MKKIFNIAIFLISISSYSQDTINKSQIKHLIHKPIKSLIDEDKKPLVIIDGYSETILRSNDTVLISKIKTKTLYFIGGFGSTMTKNDLKFTKKYNIQFHDFGCLAPINWLDYEAANYLIFENLNKEFGTDWQNEIRAGILGYAKWKKNLK